MRRWHPQELGRCRRHHARGRVLRLQRRAGPYRGVLDPRRGRHPPDDRGELVARLLQEGRGRDAGDPRLDPDRAVTPGVYTFAVLGGTGAYAGTVGEATLTDGSGAPTS